MGFWTWTKSMSEDPIKPQRWASIPDREMPLRKSMVFGGRMASAAPVLAFVARQEQFCAGVAEWLSRRAEAYRLQWPDHSDRRCQAEAAVDLIAWQRRQPDAAKTAEFIAAHEEAIGQNLK